MKKFLLSLAISLSASSAHASHQYIQCVPADRNSSDRVVISIRPDHTGTLFMSSNLETDENSGVIRLTARSQTSDNDQLILVGENNLASFRVSLSAQAFWQNSNDLPVTLTLQLKETGADPFAELLNCYSRVYE